MLRNSLSLLVAVVLIADAMSKQSPQKKSFDFQEFIGLLNSPSTLPIESLIPGGLLPTIIMSFVNVIASESLPQLPISKIKGRLLTPEEGCGFARVKNTKIIGGQNAIKGAWPWMAMLGYRHSFFGYDFNCGGSLITSRHVLTAVHCILPELKFVRLGKHDTSTTSDGPTQNVNVMRSEKHNYNEFDMKNDIAILYLEHDVYFTERTRPICLPVTEPIRDESFVNTNPFVAGWGTLKENGSLPSVLQQLQLSVLPNYECALAFARVRFLKSPIQFSSEVLCVGHTLSGRDSCSGDSGSPLMLPYFENGEFHFYQIGIVSYGYGCGHQNIPSAYSNVAFYAAWILEKLNI